MKIYFAHPVSEYDTENEAKAMDFIRSTSPEAEIINPNKAVHAEAYRQIGMDYFISLVKKCDQLFAMPFPDGRFGMGVYTEAVAMMNKNGSILEITVQQDGTVKINFLDVKNISPLSINETRERISLLLSKAT